MNKGSKKLLVFGGSFDPPHQGHKAIVDAACSVIKPDLVLIIPCNKQPLKITDSASAEHRLNMTKLMFSGSNYVVSDYEINKSGTSYTLDTLKYLEKVYRKSDIYLLIGEDSYLSFVQWKNFEEIVKKYKLVVVARSGKGLKNKFPSARSITFITNFMHPASSTDARAGDLQYIDQNVIDYINSNGLYRE